MRMQECAIVLAKGGFFSYNTEYIKGETKWRRTGMENENQTLTGRVVYGKQLGRTLGFPTANMDVENMEKCPMGVYAGLCRLDGTEYRVIINIGKHPTAPEGAPTVEAHLLDFSGDLYGREISVRLVKYLRGEVKFPSLDALREQLTRDMNEARQVEIG